LCFKVSNLDNKAVLFEASLAIKSFNSPPCGLGMAIMYIYISIGSFSSFF